MRHKQVQQKMNSEVRNPPPSAPWMSRPMDNKPQEMPGYSPIDIPSHYRPKSREPPIDWGTDRISEHIMNVRKIILYYLYY